MSKLDLHNVSKIFGTNRVLDGVSLSVGAGEVVSLIGPSGSGKSTLLRCINLLETVDEGAVLFDGVDISSRLRRQSGSAPHRNRVPELQPVSSHDSG